MRLVVKIIEMFVYVKVFLVIGVVYKVFKWYNIIILWKKIFVMKLNKFY